MFFLIFLLELGVTSRKEFSDLDVSVLTGVLGTRELLTFFSSLDSAGKKMKKWWKK